MIHASDDPSARIRNFFRPQEYFNLNVKNGVARSPSGTRFVTLPEEFLQGMHEALEDETGAAAPIVLYACGRWWGRRFVRRLFAEIRQLYKVDATAMPTSVFLHILRKVWGLYGWGQIDISFDLREHGFIEAVVDNAAYGEVVGGLGRTSEDLLAGVIAAIVSELAGRELECAQTTCLSKGDARSTFIVGLGPRVEVVTAWVKQGKNHSLVRESITSGALV